jgi:hypothetical protein
MNETMNNKAPMTRTKCQVQIEEAVAELRTAIASAEVLSDPAPDQRKEFETDICLASRSAYFDFYTWLVIHGEVDSAAEHELEGLFQRAMKVLHEGPYLDSVRDRHRDFRRECTCVRDGQLSRLAYSSATSFTDMTE